MIKKFLTLLLIGLFLFSQIQLGFCATELDYMEYATPAAAQAAYVTSAPPYRSNANIEDENMSDITDWEDLDGGGASSTQVTFDSEECMKLNSGVSGTAIRRKDTGSFGSRTVFSFRTYHDAIGNQADSDHFLFAAHNGTIRVYAQFAADGLFIYDGTDFNEVGTNLVVQDTWQEWTFDVNWTAQTVDIYLNGVLQASDVDCSAASATANGIIILIQYGTTTDNRISYVDWLKAGDDFASGGGLQSYSEDTIVQQGSYSLKVLAAITGSLNETLTRTVSPTIDLTGKTLWEFYIYSADRTGSNIKLGIRDSGLTTTETTPNITSTGAWQKVSVNISAVSDVNKDAINQIIVTILNADAANTFYLDGMDGTRRIITIQ